MAIIARLHRAQADQPGNAGESVYPGDPGLVVANGPVRQMPWGFPLATKGKSGQLLKPRAITTGIGIGIALGAFVAGGVIDAFGARSGFWVSAAAAGQPY